MKKLIILTLLCCLPAVTFAQKKKSSAAADPQALISQAQKAIQEYRFDDALESLTKAKTQLERKKQSTNEVASLIAKAEKGERALRGTDQLMVIDSFVVDKSDFLKAYKISEETGKLDSYAHFFQKSGSGTLYQNELGNRVYFGKETGDSQKKIYTADLLSDATWSEPYEVIGLGDEDTSEDYPFLTSDGSVLYFAQKGGEDNLGGYDIYVTRTGSNSSRYLKPENLGMPYNSPYNDYLFVLDEFNDLGWLASDRFQEEGKVCIYVLVPNESRRPFDYDSDDEDLIRTCAMLNNIAATQQLDVANPAEAKVRLKAALAYKPKAKVKKEFELVIDDNRTYTQFSDFRNARAKVQCQKWVEMKKELATLQESLEVNRITYSNGKYNLASTIRQQEARFEQLVVEVQEMEKHVRNLELQ